MDDTTPGKPKIKAKDSPWYLLATLYGEYEEAPRGVYDPDLEARNRDLWARNRTAWNRYMVATLTDDQRTSLIEKECLNAEDLTPFSPEELPAIEKAFSERYQQAGSTARMKLPTDIVDFSSVEFDRHFRAGGFFFPDSATTFKFGVTFKHAATFKGATFSGNTTFKGATFSGNPNFEGATFKDDATFEGVTFSGDVPFEGAIFRGATFSGKTTFEGATFKGDAIFKGATFSGDTRFWGAIFRGATFSGNATFEGSTFERATFERATFSGDAAFEGATFEDATFERATFFRNATFEGATFSDYAIFAGATFSEDATFAGATFSEGATFWGATFSEDATFEGATFSGNTYFWGATFSGYAAFERATFFSSVSFINVDIKGPTSFEGSKFNRSPPAFFGAELHEGTVWRGVKWPNLPKDAEEAGKFVDAYERLKLEMDRLKKHEDELHFFALEQQSRRILHGDWKPVTELKLFGRTVPVPPLKIPQKTITPKPKKLFVWSFALPRITIRARTITLHRPAPGLPIRLYGFLCDYGRSYVRPIYGLLFTAAIGSLPFLPYFGLSKFDKAIGLSVANTVGVLGFRKDFVDSQVIESLPGSLKVFSAMQTVAGIVLLFLFGLAIRNRFRMK